MMFFVGIAIGLVVGWMVPRPGFIDRWWASLTAK